MSNERILAQNLSVSNDTTATGLNNNDMIIGSSGSGKTGGYVIPNLQNIEGSMVVSDTKGQLRKMFTKELKAKGYQVYTLDMVNPMNSCGYNPFCGIRRHADGSYREQDVLSLAYNIVPMLDASEPFWEKAAAGYIAFLIAYCLDYLPSEKQNMSTVCRLHEVFCAPNGSAEFADVIEENPDTFAGAKFRKIRNSSKCEKMWSSIMEFANRALEVFAFKEAKKIFDASDSFDIASLGRRKTVLFLNVSDTDRTFDMLVNTFYTQALQVLCSQADANPDGRLKVPVRIIMDDFAASAKIPDFDKVISVIRSRDISVSIVLQSLTQLESMYNHSESGTIINNCDHLIYLGSQDLDTANFIAFHLGKTPEAVLSMPLTDSIVITKGEKARQVKKVQPYSTMQPEVSLTPAC